MPKEEPIDEALYQIKALIGLLQANLFKMVDTRKTIQTEIEVEALEKQVDKFISEAEKSFEELGLTKEQMRKLEDGLIPENFSREAAETILKAGELKKKIVELQDIVLKEQGEDTKKKSDKMKDKRRTKYQHKKKYKRLGGSSDWKPL